MAETIDVVLAKRVIVSPTGCWEWTGCRFSDGYGMIVREGHKRVAHRFIYQELIGPVPEGLQLDHLCRVRHCVNPRHLEPVTQRQNILRGVSPSAQHAAKTHCIHGHEFTPENTYSPPSRPQNRMCRECGRERDRQRESGWERTKRRGLKN